MQEGPSFLHKIIRSCTVCAALVQELKHLHRSILSFDLLLGSNLCRKTLKRVTTLLGKKIKIKKQATYSSIRARLFFRASCTRSCTIKIIYVAGTGLRLVHVYGGVLPLIPALHGTGSAPTGGAPCPEGPEPPATQLLLR